MLNFNNVESSSSFTPIRPGVSVRVKLEKIEVTEEGHLDFHFKGLDLDNAGTFKPRFWNLVFDQQGNDRYDEDNAKNVMRQINHILEAFMTSDQKKLIQGATTHQLYASIQANLTPNIFEGVEARMKIVYKKGSDTLCEIPRYYEFISTELKPCGLTLKDKKDDNGIPYDRVLPLASYNVTPDTGDAAPAFGGGMTVQDEVVPFGS